MKKTSWKQKIALVCLGVFFSLVILEIILRTGGAVFILAQEKRNRAHFSPDEFRILCIGESTTALGGEASFPAQLEGMLNQELPEVRFKVINKGLVGKTSKEILRALPGMLNQYRPDLVIAMIGINDQAKYRQHKDSLLGLEPFLEHFRVYQFFEILGMHIRAHLRGSVNDAETQELIDQPVDREDKYLQAVKMFVSGEEVLKKLNVRLQTPGISEHAGQKIIEIIKKVSNRQSWVLIEMARQARDDGGSDKAIKYLYHALAYDPENYGIYVELGRSYQKQKEYAKAIEAFQRAVKLSPDSVLANKGLAESYDAIGMKKQSAFFYERVLDVRGSDAALMDGEIAEWFSEHGDNEKTDQAFREAIRKNPSDYALYFKAAEFYRRIGDEKTARQFEQQGEILKYDAEDYRPATIHNYNEIIDLLALRHIPVICMQYPMRSVEPLKSVFWSDYPIIFVENKKNFQEVLKKHSYAEIFSDAFAGDFGHCRRLGNELIARNLVQSVLSVVNGKE